MSEDRTASSSRRRRAAPARSSAPSTEKGDQGAPAAADDRESSRRSPQGFGARQILAAAQELANDLEWRWETLSGLRREADGWTVAMDVVETTRIPSTTDVIAVYDVDFDAEGELLGYRRLRHYVRGRGDNEGNEQPR